MIDVHEYGDSKIVDQAWIASCVDMLNPLIKAEPKRFHSAELHVARNWLTQASRRPGHASEGRFLERVAAAVRPRSDAGRQTGAETRLPGPAPGAPIVTGGAIYKASIRFHGFAVPVKTYSAVGDTRIHFRLLHDADKVPLRHADEVIPANTLDLPGADLREKELKTARYLVGELAAELEPERYHDVRRERLMELIEKKARGEEIAVVHPEERPATRDDELLKQLEASLEAARGG